MPSNVTNFTDVIRRDTRKLCRAVWEKHTRSDRQTAPMRYTGKLIYRNFTRNVLRVQSHYTHFMRNPHCLTLLLAF